MIPASARFIIAIRRRAARCLIDEISRGIRQGEFRSDLDPELATAALLGTLFYRRLMTGEPFDPGQAAGAGHHGPRAARLSAAACLGRVRPHPRCEHMFVMYAELHCHSAFSFLDGASLPDELVPAALELGYETLALTDHNSVSGSMEFAVSARALGLRADPRGRDRPRRRPPSDAAGAGRHAAGRTCAASSRARTRTRATAGRERRPAIRRHRWRRCSSTPRGWSA